MGQQMFQQQQQQMEQRSATPSQPAASSQSRGGAPTAPFRGRGMPPTMPLRGRGGFSSRGRSEWSECVILIRRYKRLNSSIALPVRPSSPLPPNVPTGPRNKNKYKDIDSSAAAVDGLDYGGGGGKESRNTPPDYDERSSRYVCKFSVAMSDSNNIFMEHRKRRGSPGGDDVRSSKRR